jgi:hypothetical protein
MNTPCSLHSPRGSHVLGCGGAPRTDMGGALALRVAFARVLLTRVQQGAKACGSTHAYHPPPPPRASTCITHCMSVLQFTRIDTPRVWGSRCRAVWLWGTCCAPWLIPCVGLQLGARMAVNYLTALDDYMGNGSIAATGFCLGAALGSTQDTGASGTVLRPRPEHGH